MVLLIFHFTPLKNQSIVKKQLLISQYLANLSQCVWKSMERKWTIYLFW